MRIRRPKTNAAALDQEIEELLDQISHEQGTNALVGISSELLSHAMSTWHPGRVPPVEDALGIARIYQRKGRDAALARAHTLKTTDPASMGPPLYYLISAAANLIEMITIQRLSPELLLDYTQLIAQKARYGRYYGSTPWSIGQAVRRERLWQRDHLKQTIVPPTPPTVRGRVSLLATG